MHASYVVPTPGVAGQSHVRVTVLGTPPGDARYVQGAVLVSPTGRMHRLTPRELEILGLMIEGWSNQHIASALGVSARTVASHVEHVMVKLRASTRELAAVRAVRQGLYVPRALSHPG